MALSTTPAVKIPSRPEYAGILKQQEVFATGSADSADRLNSWYDELLLQSGSDVRPIVLLLLSVLCAIAIGGGVFVLQENLLSTAIAALLGFVIPTALLMYQRSQRQQKIMQQLPAMLEELARAAKTGRSIEQCLQLVASDTPAPLQDEMAIVSRRLSLGVPMSEALADLPARTGLMTLNLLCTTLTVHQQTGGDLVVVLERLSRTIRDRLAYLGRLRATTAASRATAILMIVLPPLVVAFFAFRDPNYFTDLMRTQWSRVCVFTAIGLQLVGTFLVWRILKNSERA